MLIDRGQRHETIFLKGNHEAMLLDLLRDPEIFPTFKQYGGLQTLLSYGLTPSANPGHDEQQALIGDWRKFHILIVVTTTYDQFGHCGCWR